MEIVCASVQFVLSSEMLIASQMQKATNRLMRCIIHFNKTQASSAPKNPILSVGLLYSRLFNEWQRPLDTHNTFINNNDGSMNDIL